MINPEVHQALKLHADAVSELEKRLDLPRGVFAGMGSDPDSVIVLKIAIAVEAVLNDKIAEIVTSATSHPKAHFDGVSSLVRIVRKSYHKQKIQLALEIGIITSIERQWLIFIADLRNQYAHHIRNFAKSAWDVASELADKNSVRQLCFGHEFEEDLRRGIMALHVLVFIDFLNRIHSFNRIPNSSLMDLLKQDWKTANAKFNPVDDRGAP